MVIKITVFKVSSAFSNFRGIESAAGNLHCPSSAILAPSSEPSLASMTVDSGVLNLGSGESKTGVMTTPVMINNIFKKLFNFPVNQ